MSTKVRMILDWPGPVATYLNSLLPLRLAAIVRLYGA
jgi:hypothetical protein